jgi:putative ABC transport system permease protein
VIAMMSVSEGAAREALSQVEALGMNNLVVRSRIYGLAMASPKQLMAGDAARAAALVPAIRGASPLVERFMSVRHADRSVMTRVLGVQAAFQEIVELSAARGRLLTPTDERALARVCVLGAGLARQLFSFRDPLGQAVRLGSDYYQVVGILRDDGKKGGAGSTIAWRDLNTVALAPLPSLSGRTLDVVPSQPADEIWVHVADGERAAEIGQILQHTLRQLHGAQEFDVVVPRELLAQRFRTQRTFSIVIGSVAALALLIGGIGIMNMMLTSVSERTQEIGLRRTVGATRRHVTVQFLVEALLMTLGGGVLGVGIGAGAALAITAYAGWQTHISAVAVLIASVVSVGVGLVFGLYPAIKAARLEPVDAVRYE